MPRISPLPVGEGGQRPGEGPAPARSLAKPAPALALVLLALAACSPEASRTREGGPGADVGNRPAVIQIHGTVNPSFQEPIAGKAAAVK